MQFDTTQYIKVVYSLIILIIFITKSMLITNETHSAFEKNAYIIPCTVKSTNIPPVRALVLKY